jgi:hypothetical protein
LCQRGIQVIEYFLRLGEPFVIARDAIVCALQQGRQALRFGYQNTTRIKVMGDGANRGRRDRKQFLTEALLAGKNISIVQPGRALPAALPRAFRRAARDARQRCNSPYLGWGNSVAASARIRHYNSRPAQGRFRGRPQGRFSEDGRRRAALILAPRGQSPYIRV